MERKREMIRLRDLKMTYEEIGKVFGLTRSRVHQILKGYEVPNWIKMKWEQERKEHKRKYQTQYSRKWRKKNKEHYLQYSRDYYNKNKKRRSQIMKRYNQRRKKL